MTAQRRPRHVRAHARARRAAPSYGRRLAGLRAPRARAELLGAGARRRDLERRPATTSSRSPSAGPRRASTRPPSWPAITADVFEEEGGEALSYLPAEGLYALREQLAARGRADGFAAGRRTRSSSPRAPSRAISLTARATLEPGDVASSSRPPSSGMLDSLRQTGARVIGVPVDENGFDVDALERLLARHEVKLVGAPDAPARTRPAATSPRSAARASPSWRWSATSSSSRTASTPTCSFDREPTRPLRELAPGARDLRELALEGGRRRPARRLGRRARPGARADRDAEARGGLPLADADPAHRGALARHRRLRPPRGAHAARSTASAATRCWRRSSGTCPASTRPTAPRAATTSGSRSRGRSTSARSTARPRATAWPSRRADAVTAERRTQTSFRLSFSLLDPDELDEGVRRLARAIREVRRRARHTVAAPMS